MTEDQARHTGSTVAAVLVALSMVAGVYGFATPSDPDEDVTTLVLVGISIICFGLLGALVYVTGVFVVQSILPGAQTNLAAATSTLAAAGLFTPLRLPNQRVVDHRFNRSHYDAERVIEEFAGGIRNQVDLEEVASGLRLVLDRTIQPVTTEIWLRSQP